MPSRSTVEPPACLDGLLLGEQARRHPLLTQPSELAAFVLRRRDPEGSLLRAYFPACPASTDA